MRLLSFEFMKSIFPWIGIRHQPASGDACSKDYDGAHRERWLRDYESAAIHRARFKVDARIRASSKELTVILLRAMLGNLLHRSHVVIYSHSLPEELFGGLIGSNAASVSILVDDDSNLCWVRDEAVRNGWSIRKTEASRSNNFLASSCGCFWLNEDASSFGAEANFNEPLAVGTLVKAFNRYSVESVDCLQ